MVGTLSGLRWWLVAGMLWLFWGLGSGSTCRVTGRLCLLRNLGWGSTWGQDLMLAEDRFRK